MPLSKYICFSFKSAKLKKKKHYLKQGKVWVFLDMDHMYGWFFCTLSKHSVYSTDTPPIKSPMLYTKTNHTMIYNKHTVAITDNVKGSHERSNVLMINRYLIVLAFFILSIIIDMKDCNKEQLLYFFKDTTEKFGDCL